MSFRLIRVAVLVVAVSMAAFCRNAGNKASASDLIWEPAPPRQDDFDGIPLPESSDVPTATQITPAVVNIGQRYGVPQSSGKKKHNHVKKDDFTADHVLHGASLMSSTTLMSLGVLALLVAAGKALLLALAAVALTCLVSAAGPLAGSTDGAAASTVYEVITRPQYTFDHSYSTEVHHEPYAPTLAEYGYGGFAPP